MFEKHKWAYVGRGNVGDSDSSEEDENIVVDTSKLEEWFKKFGWKENADVSTFEKEYIDMVTLLFQLNPELRAYSLNVPSLPPLFSRGNPDQVGLYTEKLCDDGHGLIRFEIPEDKPEDFVCNLCGDAPIPIGSVMYGCDECEYNVCGKCESVSIDLEDINYRESNQGK